MGWFWRLIPFGRLAIVIKNQSTYIEKLNKMKRLKLNFGNLQSAELLSREQLKNVLGGSKLVGSTADCSGECTTNESCGPHNECRVDGPQGCHSCFAV